MDTQVHPQRECHSKYLQGRKVGATVTSTDDKKLKMKDYFWQTKAINSPSLICLVVILSRPIADLVIINKAVESSRTVDTALEGDDTDLLILLCYHAELDVLDLFFPTRIKSKFQASILEYKISEGKAWPRDLSSHSFYPCY